MHIYIINIHKKFKYKFYKLWIFDWNVNNVSRFSIMYIFNNIRLCKKARL